MKGFKIAHLNSRSVLPKIDSIRLWMEERKFDIVTLSETWLHESIDNSMLDVGAFDIFRLDRARRCKGGGLATLIKRDENYIVNSEKYRNIWVSNADCELQIIEVKPGNIRKTLVLNCYRPPAGSINNFVNHISETLDAVAHFDEFDTYICGDFNIPYNDENSVGVNKLKSLENKYGLKQYITTPTHCTAQSKNILDLIFYKCQAHQGSCGR